MISANSPFQGAKISNLSPAVAEDLRLDASAQGVVIVDIASGSAAQSLGFQRGEIVISVNNTKIVRTRDLERIAALQTRLWRITIVRGGQQMSVELRG
jgi:S1-C subfamily serine protease